MQICDSYIRQQTGNHQVMSMVRAKLFLQI